MQPLPPQQRQCCLSSPLKIARVMRYVALFGAVVNLYIYNVHVQTKSLQFELLRQGAPEAAVATVPARANSQSASENSALHHRALMVANDAPFQSSRLSLPARPSSATPRPRSILRRGQRHRNAVDASARSNSSGDADSDNDDGSLRREGEPLTPPPVPLSPPPPITDINDTAIPASARGVP